MGVKAKVAVGIGVNVGSGVTVGVGVMVGPTSWPEVQEARRKRMISQEKRINVLYSFLGIESATSFIFW